MSIDPPSEISLSLSSHSQLSNLIVQQASLSLFIPSNVTFRNLETPRREKQPSDRDPESGMWQLVQPRRPSLLPFPPPPPPSPTLTPRAAVVFGVRSSALWQHCRIRLSHLVMGGRAEPADVTQRLLQGSDAVQSSVIFGGRITLCHEMDLLILLCACVHACVCVCVHWYDP